MGVERFAVVVVVGLVAVVIAWVLQRRGSAEAPVRTGFNVPAQLHRADFTRPEADWLVVVFTSVTCDSCAGVWDKVRLLDSAAVATEEVEVTARRDVHDRYAIDAVPTTVIVDRNGVVRASFLGPATATDLWAAVAELREPGTLPDTCESHLHPADGDRA